MPLCIRTFGTTTIVVMLNITTGAITIRFVGVLEALVLASLGVPTCPF